MTTNDQGLRPWYQSIGSYDSLVVTYLSHRKRNISGWVLLRLYLGLLSIGMVNFYICSF